MPKQPHGFVLHQVRPKNEKHPNETEAQPQRCVGKLSFSLAKKWAKKAVLMGMVAIRTPA